MKSFEGLIVSISSLGNVLNLLYAVKTSNANLHRRCTQLISDQHSQATLGHADHFDVGS